MLVAVVLILLVGGYGSYRVYKHFKRLAGGAVSQIVQNAGAPKTLKDLLGLGTAQKCTYSGGAVYVSGGKVRGDFTASESGKTINSHMIVDGNISYIWTDGEKAGFKMTFNPDATSAPSSLASPSTAEAGQSGMVDAEKPQDYKCEGWVADPAMFSLPAGVTFQDFSSLMPSAMPQTQGSGGSSSSQCSYCDNLTGSDKTQCLSALNCK